MAMKDMIKEILDADRLTQDTMESAEKLKLESSRRMDEFLKKREAEYRYKVMMNKKIIEKIEDSKAGIEISKIQRDCQQVLDRVEAVYQKLKEEWSDTLFNNIIESQL